MSKRAPGPGPSRAERARPTGGRREALVARVTGSLPARVCRRMIEIGGYDRAVALAAQAFMSLLPMLLVLGALLPADTRGRRIGWRALLPGSVVTGAGQGLVVAVSGVYLPVSAAHEAARYGAVGVAVAFVSWLVVLGLLLVVAAVVGAELARPGRPPGGR